MDSSDSTSPKDDWPKKPIEIAPKDLADLIEEIWGLKTTKPKSPSKSSTSSPKKAPEKDKEGEKIKSHMDLFPSHFDPSMYCHQSLLSRHQSARRELEADAEERETFMRQMEKKIMEMRSRF